MISRSWKVNRNWNQVCSGSISRTRWFMCSSSWNWPILTCMVR